MPSTTLRLYDYMQQIGATNFDDDYQSLIKSLDKKPSNIPSVPKKYQYDQYEDNFEKSVCYFFTKAVLDVIISEKKYIIPLFQRQLSQLHQEIPGLNNTKKHQKIYQKNIFIISACRYETILNIGLCQERSAYSAICLYRMLKNTKVHISLQGAKTYDHAAVVLGAGSNPEQYYVYDPLINPEMVIPITAYQTDILPLFRQQKTFNSSPFKLMISSNLCTLYERLKRSVIQDFSNLLNQTNPSELWDNVHFSMKNNFTKESFVLLFQQLQSIIDSTENDAQHDLSFQH